jgi:hypothetical protein
MEFAAIILGLATLPAAYQAFFRERGTAQIAFLAVAAALCFWYWSPAINLLTLGFLGTDIRSPTRESVVAATWLIFWYEVVLIAILAAARPLLSPLPPLCRSDIDDRKIDWLGYVALASAAGFLTARFARDGLGVLLDLAIGLASARDNASFYNRSEDAATSLLALWEIANIWIALVVIALMTWRRTLLSGPGIAALGAIAILFLASGTRAVLMQALFVIGMTVAVRGPAITAIRRKANLVYLVPLFAIAGLAFSAFASRFRDTAGSGGFLTILDTLVVNPDMTRELAFVLDRMPNFLSQSAGPFVITPFAYALPRFLGFDRSMPEHLVAFNAIRGDIDLLFGQGNIFPGIIADFQMVFGMAGAFLMGLFVAFHALVLDRVARLIPNLAQRGAFLTTCIAYMFFSFRNIGGMLFLVVVLGLATIYGANQLRPAWQRFTGATARNNGLI